MEKVKFELSKEELSRISNLLKFSIYDLGTALNRKSNTKYMNIHWSFQIKEDRELRDKIRKELEK